MSVEDIKHRSKGPFTSEHGAGKKPSVRVSHTVLKTLSLRSATGANTINGTPNADYKCRAFAGTRLQGIT